MPNQPESSDHVSVDDTIDAIAQEALAEARRIEEAERYFADDPPVQHRDDCDEDRGPQQNRSFVSFEECCVHVHPAMPRWTPAEPCSIVVSSAVFACQRTQVECWLSKR